MGNLPDAYESWVERQIREAIERGEFDNLPGAGQPIPGLNGRDEENWWVKRFLEREKIPMPLAHLAGPAQGDRQPAARPWPRSAPRTPSGRSSRT